MDESKPDFVLDLRGVICPLNFVKTKLFLDKMRPGQIVKVLIDAGEPVESVSTSIQDEGHKIIRCAEDESQSFALSIRKE